jgi:hypothetical protein
MHGKSGATVDYYRTVTGTPRIETAEDPRNPGVHIRLLRVDVLIDLFTCRECWADPGVQAALEQSRRTGEVRPA